MVVTDNWLILSSLVTVKSLIHTTSQETHFIST